MSGLDERLEQRIYFFTDLAQTVIYSGLALYGEHLQDLVRAGSSNYNWFIGHTSDFFLPAAAGSALNLITDLTEKGNKRKLLRMLPLIGFAAYYSFNEFEQFLVSKFPDLAAEYKGTFELQDIACFWAGAAAAYFTPGIVKSAVNFFKKYSNQTEEVQA